MIAKPAAHARPKMLTDAALAAIFAPVVDLPTREELYLEKCGVDHMLRALRSPTVTEFRAHVLAYRRIERVLIATGTWEKSANG